MKPSRWSHLLLAEALAVALLLLSFVRMMGDAQSKGFRGSVLQTVFSGSIWGTTLVRNLVLFAAALLLLHLLFGLLCWGIARASAVAWPSRDVPLNQHMLIWFILMTVALLAYNSAAFPRSSLGSPYARTMMVETGGMTLGVWIALLVLAALAVTVVIAARRRLDLILKIRKPVALAGTAAILATAVAIALPAAHSRAAAYRQPNVILIGIDSLRLDVVAPQTSPGVTPNVDAFLAKAVSFTNAITPLARTFPSLTSILTGRSPHRTGAVVNLLPRDLVQEADTIGRMLGRAGYATAYGIDEVRFANIDTTYGFDQAITPPIGASEFLISLFADTPISNLFVNTAMGRLLFPHVHANRGAALVYDPDLFVERIDRAVAFDRPTLLHVHLTLPHWPYTWIDAPLPRTALGEKTDPSAKWPVYYLDSVRRADRQFGDLLAILERRGALENAIVIVYSDHGETFGYDAESLVPADSAELAALNAKPGFGHGTSVLAPLQYHCVLGIRGFGANALQGVQARNIDAPVTMQDIAPTLVELLSVSARNSFDGRSLAPLLKGDAAAAAGFEGRIRFTESEYDPGNVVSATGQVSASAIASAASVYRVDPVTDRIEIQRSRLAMLLRARQYAAIGSQFMVAAIPGESGFQFVAIDQDSGRLERLRTAPTTEAPAEIQALWSALHTEFSAALDAAPAGPAPPVSAGLSRIAAGL